jgi:chromosome segregation ATPase
MDIKAEYDAAKASIEQLKADLQASESLTNEAVTAKQQAENALTEAQVTIESNKATIENLKSETVALSQKVDALNIELTEAKQQAEADKQAALQAIAGSGNAPVSNQPEPKAFTKAEARAEYAKLMSEGKRTEADAIWDKYCN